VKSPSVPFQSRKVFVDIVHWAGAGRNPHQIEMSALSWVRHPIATHAIMVRYLALPKWRVFAALLGSHTDMRMAWRWASTTTAVGLRQASLALVVSPRRSQPSPLAIPVGAQLVLHHSLAPQCATCAGPIEHRPGRPGRPRRHCEVCRPPTWPRRGETWEVDGREYVVLGSITRPNRSVRARPVDSALARWMDVGAEWINARRIHPTIPTRSAS